MMSLQKLKQIVEVYKLFIFILFLGNSYNLLSNDLYSSYQNSESLNLKRINNFLEDGHFFNKVGNILPQSIEAIEYIHPYAGSVENFTNSRNFLSSLLKNNHKLSDTLLINVLEIVYAGYRSEFLKENESIFLRSEHPKILAITYLYLYRQDKISLKVQKKFESSGSFNYLSSIKKNLTQQHLPHPSLSEILFHKFPTYGYTLYVLRKNFSSKLFIKTANNEFLKNSLGEPIEFSVNSRSVIDLPYYLPLGNTPEGIFKIKSVKNSQNPRIGPTPVVQLNLPYEISPEEFFPGSGEIIWSKELYSKLLPETWKNYPAIFQSFEAGKNGRSGIWIHGSTLDPNRFENLKDRNTLTYGCISLPEIWENGYLKRSYQLELLKILGENIEGYVVVIEVESLEKALEEIKKPRQAGL